VSDKNMNADTETGIKVFIARQPIFDHKKNVYAYELLYHSDFEKQDIVFDNEDAALKVIANSFLIGLQKLTDGKRAFINFNRKLLLAQTPFFFPNHILGVEIPGTVIPDETIIMICRRIKNSGYLMIMDDSVYKKEEYRPFIGMADIIKVDFRAAGPEERQTIFQTVASGSRAIKFLAVQIETQQEYEEARTFGYHYFQGLFFRRPSLISRKEMPGYKLNYVNILRKIFEPGFNVDGIDEIVKRDVSLTYKLLRFINSAAFGFRVTIRSIRHALILLGKREVRRWLTIIVMSSIGSEKPIELMNAAVIRARLCELIAVEFKLPDQPSDLFLIGMLSMMDAFLDRPLPEILEELPLEENIKSVLLGGRGRAHDVIEMIKAYEKADWESFSQSAQKLGLDEKKLVHLYLDAVEWAKLITKQEE
jgi:c-di-GMP-related signal transduction protein